LRPVSLSQWAVVYTILAALFTVLGASLALAGTGIAVAYRALVERDFRDPSLGVPLAVGVVLPPAYTLVSATCERLLSGSWVGVDFSAVTSVGVVAPYAASLALSSVLWVRRRAGSDVPRRLRALLLAGAVASAAVLPLGVAPPPTAGAAERLERVS